LVQLCLIKLALNIGIGFHLCQPQNMIHFLPHGKHIFKWSKMGHNSTNTTHTYLEIDLDQAEKKLGELAY
jgi:hypothetical protein